HYFLPVFRADLDHREVLFFRGLIGEAPFVLKPGLFRLFHNEPDLNVFCANGRLEGKKACTDDGAAFEELNKGLHDTWLGGWVLGWGDGKIALRGYADG